jgi:hypothetical protein
MVPARNRREQAPVEPEPLYFGGAVPVGNQSKEDVEDVLPLPAMNWDEEATQSQAQ